MKLSVIIVNYNVEFFLEQCLLSVEKALKKIDAEVWVVDNNSVDYSVAMLQRKFPKVKLILNPKNLGFSVANNQAIKQAQGDYILLLNPDTIVEEDTFDKVIAFMDTHPKVGGLGVKMLDGKGNFLPESKRGLPSPLVAFFKIFGLSALFPKSKLFGRYYLGFLDHESIHEVDVLTGAFMLIPKRVLNEIGLLDEQFFMYGEDIDLSYRITKSGYKNIYFPETNIIHFKGESTKKSSINYVFVFYKAMLIFAQKHFSSRWVNLFKFCINFAIYFRASTAILSRFIKRIYLPILDIALLYGGIYFIQDFWEKTYLRADAYPWYYELYILPFYIFVWMLSALFNGAYDKPYRVANSVKGIGFGTIAILIIYALLPEYLRFSRMIILFSTVWAMFASSFLRLFLRTLKINDFEQIKSSDKRIAIIGEYKEAQRVAELLRSSSFSPGFIGLVELEANTKIEDGVIGTLDNLDELLVIYKLNELVFCSDCMEASEIIRQMARFNKSKLAFKIAPNKSTAVIGSQSILQAENLYMIDIDGILKPNNKRAKRLFDVFISILLLFLSPFICWFIKEKGSFYRNLFQVLFGFKSWIGYDPITFAEQDKLPTIKSGILFPKDAFPDKALSNAISAKLNLMYAQDYKMLNDWQIVYKAFTELGRKN
ncbi:MAG: glycosyltransferase [Bacteroidales bacterium]|nr:glycosyltransferase [Bacteroidales bacterium]